MTLDEMCMMAARYSDRYDEFEKTLDGGDSQDPEDWYEDDAMHYFRVFRDAINEAHREVSRLQAQPDVYTRVQVGEDGLVDLSTLTPAVYQVKDVFVENRTSSTAYVFDTKYMLKMQTAKQGDYVVVYYHYIPDDLELLDDSPVFTEAVVDPMVYVSLAVARMWQSEKKMEFFSYWYNQYREHLRNVRSSMLSSAKRRIPRRLFR